MRKLIERYCGMYVHVIAFAVGDLGQMDPIPGQKWGYLVGVRHTVEETDEMIEMIYGPNTDDSDYFTREAAEQAPIHHPLWQGRDRRHHGLGPIALQPATQALRSVSCSQRCRVPWHGAFFPHATIFSDSRSKGWISKASRTTETIGMRRPQHLLVRLDHGKAR